MLNSCGIIPTRVVGGERQFLLLENHSHWDFPKGGMEEDETELECAIRELFEESNLSAPSFDWGEAKYTTEAYSKPKKVAIYYIASIAPDAIVKLLPNPQTGLIEHHSFRWVRYSDAWILVKPRIQKALEFAQEIITKSERGAV